MFVVMLSMRMNFPILFPILRRISGWKNSIGSSGGLIQAFAAWNSGPIYEQKDNCHLQTMVLVLELSIVTSL